MGKGVWVFSGTLGASAVLDKGGQVKFLGEKVESSAKIAWSFMGTPAGVSLSMGSVAASLTTASEEWPLFL